MSYLNIRHLHNENDKYSHFYPINISFFAWFFFYFIEKAASWVRIHCQQLTWYWIFNYWCFVFRNINRHWNQIFKRFSHPIWTKQNFRIRILLFGPCCFVWLIIRYCPCFCPCCFWPYCPWRWYYWYLLGLALNELNIIHLKILRNILIF